MRNDGNSNLDISATTITGADASLFSVTSGGGAFAVAPGNTHDVVIEFTPSLLGAKAATLEIASNDPDEPTLNLLLLGESVESILGDGSVLFEDVVTGIAVDAVSVSTAANPVTAANDLYLAAITSKRLEHVTSVDGMGMTWTLVAKQCGGRGQTGVEVWMARSASPSAGAVTATFAQQTNAAVLSVSRYSGVHSTAPLGTPVTASTLGISAACSDTGTDTGNYAVPITAIANTGLVYGAIARRSNAHTPDPGWTEHVDTQAGSGGSTAGLVCVDSTVAGGNVTLSGSFSGTVDWAVVAVEVLPAPSSTTDVEPDALVPDRTVLEVRASDHGPVITLVSPDWTHLQLTVHDVRGRLINTLWNGQRAARPAAVRMET